jgi:central glycolytic genes regulator
MRKIIDIQKQLLPDLTDVLKKRYTILHHIMLADTVGRRTLAGLLHMPERVLRAETDKLKALGLIDIGSHGMRITDAGRRLLEDFEPIVRELFDLSELEERIARLYGLKQVIIVPGDSDESPITKKELGRAGAAVLRRSMAENDVIAVSGGSTIAELANHLTNTSPPLKGIRFVPARGGLGESLELQANTVASMMAKRTGTHYRLLHVPDHLSEEAYQSLILDPNIREILEVIRQSRIVVHGIGDAMTMATRRKADPETFAVLREEGALAEAFGYYFNRDGEVVHKMPTLGLRLEDIQEVDLVIAVAGGGSKGEAIAAVLRFGHEDVLVTDEAAALKVLEHTPQ